MQRQPLSTLLLVLASLCTACLPLRDAPRTVRLLFVGNSLTYVGNLPAVFDALAGANGKSADSDMIVRGGATLTEHRADATVARALAGTRYDYVLLQERGGDMICAFGPASCEDAGASLGALARLVSAHHATPVLLGTHQVLPRVSVALVEAETAAATRLAIAHVAVSDRLVAARASTPGAAWLHEDGAHPGHDLTLLEAVLVYRLVFAELPAVNGFTVHAPMHAPGAKFAAPVRTSESAGPMDVPQLHTYIADRVAAVLAIAGEHAQ